MKPRTPLAMLAAGILALSARAAEPVATLGRPVAVAEPTASIGRPIVRAQAAELPKPVTPYPAPIRPFPTPTTNPEQAEPNTSPIKPPPMIGDLPGYQALRTVTVKTQLSTGAMPNYGVVEDKYNVLAPVPNRGAFKIAENESPAPQDRAYVTYNYYQGAPVRVQSRNSTLTLADGNIFPLRSTLAGTTGNVTADPLSALTHTNISSADIHREVLGIEKTFLDGLFSVGLRLPFYNLNQTTSATPDAGRLYAFTGAPGGGQVTLVSNGLDSGGVGDLSILLKLGLLNDEETGSVVSIGLMTTTPTGEGVIAGTKTLRSVLLQPFTGWLTTCDNWYIHGFSSILVGTEAAEPLLMFNDVGVGYIVQVGCEADFLRAIIPTLECHVNTPLRRGTGDVLQLVDTVTLTGGVHFDMVCNSLLTVAGSTPLTGPQPYSFELAVYYNYRY